MISQSAYTTSLLYNFFTFLFRQILRFEQSSAATAKLSDVIQEANRVLEQEKRDMHSTGGATSGRNNVDATQANRLAPKKDYSAEPTFLGENDGISTYHRPDAHSSRRNDEGNLDDVPKNRIFLNQKQRYEG